MQPYISPLFFYLTSIVGVIKPILLVIGPALLFIVLVLFIMGIDEDVDYFDKEDEEVKDFIKILKKGTRLGILLFTLGILVPTEKTCYKMLATSMVTPDNVKIVANNGKELVDYIVDSVDKIVNDDNKD